MLCALLTGCAKEKLYPLIGNHVAVKKEKIYRDNQLFAELRCLEDIKKSACSGLSIYYYPYDKEVWIYPEKGFHLHVIAENKIYSTIPEIKKMRSEFRRQRAFSAYEYYREDVLRSHYKILPRAFKIHISDDGKYVYYKIWGIFFNSSYRYSVEEGISRYLSRNLSK